MNVQDMSILTTLFGKYSSKETYLIKGTPGGQISIPLTTAGEDHSITWQNSNLEFNAVASSEGIVVEGYFLGTYDFDSLTGHPGIKY